MAERGRSTGLTSRGWALLVFAAVAFGVGWSIGVAELDALAAAAVTAVVAGAVYAHRQAFRLEVTRTLHPPQSAPGRTNAVEVRLHNPGSKPTPVLGVTDPFDGGGPRRLLAPLGGGAHQAWRYDLPELRRGRFAIGPLTAEVTDPFGLARRVRTFGAPTRLTVHPRVEALRAPVVARASQQEGPAASVRDEGQDFASLREYVPGDDLRRVHWPSSARTDTLLVREDVVQRLGRVVVVLDLRRPLWSAAALEVAVEAAASVADDALARGLQVRVVATDGSDSTPGAGARHRTRVLDLLAEADWHSPAGGAPLPASVATATGTSDHTIICTSDRAGADDIVAMAGRRRRAPVTVVVVEPRSRPTGTDRRAPAATPTGVRVVRVGAGRDFAAAWNEAARR